MTGRTRAITVRPFAKINLSLRVGPAQPDGYHDVRTLLQSIALTDTLIVKARQGPIRLIVDVPGVPSDRTNLVSRAAAALWQAMGKRGEPRGAEITLEKTIPAAAGLGGGSSDAAATLVVLNRVWKAGFTTPELADVAATLGADVPFFLYGGSALGVGRGDEIYPVEDVKRLGVVVITPAFGVSTAEAYRWLDEERAGAGDWPAVAPPAVDVGWPGRPVALMNDLQGPVMRRFPQISMMLEACRRAGALGAAMSGSGSSVFGLFALPALRQAAVRLKRPDWAVMATRTLSRHEAAGHLGL